MNLNEVIALGKSKIALGESLELAHIIKSEGSTPRGNDAYMLIDAAASSYGTVGGGKIEYQATIDGAELLKEGSSFVKGYSLSREASAELGMICGGSVEIEFVCLKAGSEAEIEASIRLLSDIENEYLLKQGRVIIFGGGHVSEETVPVLTKIGFPCIVYDDRAEFLTSENFPEARELICEPYDDVLSHVEITAKDYVVIMTRGHQYDYEVQKQVLKTEAAFIGVIGSRAKLAAINDKLIADGYNEKDLERFYAPVGLQIAAETPEEIAVSIAAELILVRANIEKRRKVTQGRTLKLEDVRTPK